MSKLKRPIMYWYGAMIYAAGFLALTGLVPAWGNWYSARLHYREQTDAFFRGSLALSATPCALQNDLVWHAGGVQQVWGLGVPIWRVPFEFLARITGQDMFPDRLAFGIALLLLAFFTMRIMIEATEKDIRHEPQFLIGAVATAMILFFPPVVLLCHYRFDVYEEAVAYGYVCGVSLFIAIIAFDRKPSCRKYLLISLFAGLVPFVRPTLGAYSMATIITLQFLAGRARLRIWQRLVGLGCFCAGGLLLFYTNYLRFGGGFEFGHNLNLNGFPIWFYGRFCNPLARESLISVLREFFGATFCTPILNDFDWMRPCLYPGQCSAPRWRHFYATTFDFSYLIALLLAWGASVRCALAHARRKFVLSRSVLLSVVWSAIGILCLAGFYLRTPFISNRYVLDLAPGMAAAIVGFLFSVATQVSASRHWQRWCWGLLTLTMLWFLVEFWTSQTTAQPSPAITKEEVRSALSVPYRTPGRLPHSYSAGDNLAQYGIPYNGVDWHINACMPAMVPLFVEDPEFLKLLVAPFDQNKQADYSKLRAKIGLQFLNTASIEDRGTNCIITFNPPTRSVYRRGIQMAFIAYVDEDDLNSNASPIQLLKVQWQKE